MDLSSIIGFVAALGLIVWGMQDGTGALGNFVDAASIAIVFGGTFAALVIAFPLKVFKQIPKHFKIIVKPPKNDPFDYIDNIIELAKEARKKGLLALEDKANEAEDPFLQSSVMLIVDAMEPSKVKGMLESELDNLDERHANARSFYDTGAGLAPALGMIGTLIGLINMLKVLGNDISLVSEGMAVALITTFYGSMLANIFFIPISAKLKSRHDDEMLCKQIVVEGIIAIQAGENPKHIEEKLLAYLPQRMREKYRARGAAPEGGEGGEGGAGGKGNKKPKKEKPAKKEK